jgi:phosphoribosylaminoimidazolecarboxamide formyltransferase/IMP cyclohydrolase
MRALLSVHDKTGLVDLARGLHDLGWELVSSGGTAAAVAAAGIPVVEVADVTGVPEMPGGLVKTLHPAVHAGILADTTAEDHVAYLEQQGVAPIDLVVCNLYPFRTAPSVQLIDVGGPTMVRAAAKNHARVGVVVDPAEYGPVLAELRADGSLSGATRRRLARAAFAHTAAYDAAIVGWLDDGADEVLPPTLHLALERVQDLRYGENPHQTGARYRAVGTTGWWDDVVQHAGLSLSYLNLYDADAAWSVVHDLGDGPGSGDRQARQPVRGGRGRRPGDRLPAGVRLRPRARPSAASSRLIRPVDDATVERMVGCRAGRRGDRSRATARGSSSGCGPSARTRACSSGGSRPRRPPHLRTARGGGLPRQDAHQLSVRRAPTGGSCTEVEPDRARQWPMTELAWRVCGWVRSNSIVLVEGGTAWGIGAGQQNRSRPVQIAGRPRRPGGADRGAAASDAVLPLPRRDRRPPPRPVWPSSSSPAGRMRDAEISRRRRRARPRHGPHRRAPLYFLH